MLLGLNPVLINATGYSWTGDYVTVTGDLCADSLSNIASEQRAKVVYEYLYRQVNDKKYGKASTFSRTGKRHTPRCSERHSMRCRTVVPTVTLGQQRQQKCIFPCPTPGPMYLRETRFLRLNSTDLLVLT